MKKVLIAPFVGLIKLYQLALSPYLPPSCRFEPSCSVYALGVLKKFGLFQGSYLAARRIFSCNPWGRSGYDPVPEKFSFRKPNKTSYEKD
ncbi:MAG: membrane protein insertion efficiency factor YidD [Bacteroidota bacterium]